jgi:hypothetical protein
VRHGNEGVICLKQKNNTNMKELNELAKEIEEIKLRNQKVEADKA